MSEKKRDKINSKYGDVSIMQAINTVNEQDGAMKSENIVMIISNQKQEKMLVDRTDETFESRLRV